MKEICVSIFIGFAVYLGFSQTLINPHSEAIKYVGRFNFDDEEVVRFAWPGSSIEFFVESKKLEFRLSNFSVADTNHYGSQSFYYLFVDNSLPIKFYCKSIDSLYQFDLGTKKTHHIKLYKLTETHVGVGAFYGILLSKGEKLLNKQFENKPKIEFVGNSITCGYGAEGENQFCDFKSNTENNYLSYAGVASRIINYEPSFTAWSGKGVLRNYDMDSVNTLPYLYKRIIAVEEKEWGFPESRAPEVVVINLGTNDFAHQNPDPIKFKQAYEQLIFQIRYYNPKCKIVCLIGPMMSEGWPKGHHVLSTFRGMLQELIDDLELMGMEDLFVFEMSRQGDLGYGCDWHPSTPQHKKNGDELAEFLTTEVIRDK